MNVTCTRCGSPPNVMCTTPSGKERADHAVREKADIEWWENNVVATIQKVNLAQRSHLAFAQLCDKLAEHGLVVTECDYEPDGMLLSPNCSSALIGDVSLVINRPEAP